MVLKPQKKKLHMPKPNPETGNCIRAGITMKTAGGGWAPLLGARQGLQRGILLSKRAISHENFKQQSLLH
jgi:hypothetical protein